MQISYLYASDLLSKTFANSLNMQKQYEKMFGKRVIDDVHHVVACTGVFEIDGEMSPRCVDRRWSIGVRACITPRLTAWKSTTIFDRSSCVVRFTTFRRLGDRFREHLRSTRQSNTDLPVARHFASPRHASTDMLVSVIHSGFRDIQNRRLFEARMIFKYKTLHPGGLNTDFAFL